MDPGSWFVALKQIMSGNHSLASAHDLFQEKQTTSPGLHITACPQADLGERAQFWLRWVQSLWGTAGDATTVM